MFRLSIQYFLALGIVLGTYSRHLAAFMFNVDVLDETTGISFFDHHLETMSSSSGETRLYLISSPVLLDGILQAYFLGIVTAQFSRYWYNYRHDDHVHKKVFVILVALLAMRVLRVFIRSGYSSDKGADFKLVWRTTRCLGSRSITRNGCVARASGHYTSMLMLGCLKSTSRLQWVDIFLNGSICTLCEAFFIRRCWRVSFGPPYPTWANQIPL